jgi:hypothetical protein
MIDHSKADTGGLCHFFSLVAKTLVRIFHNITGRGWGLRGKSGSPPKQGKSSIRNPYGFSIVAFGGSLVVVLVGGGVQGGQGVFQWLGGWILTVLPLSLKLIFI